jgi:hypothetical protein
MLNSHIMLVGTEDTVCKNLLILYTWTYRYYPQKCIDTYLKHGFVNTAPRVLFPLTYGYCLKGRMAITSRGLWRQYPGTYGYCSKGLMNIEAKDSWIL